MEVLKLKVKSTLCDSGVYCDYNKKYIGTTMANVDDVVKIVQYLNSLDKDDLNALCENYISNEKVQSGEWALKQVTKLKGC